MKIIKYTTENLKCYRAFDSKGQEHYQIFEKANETKPIMIYVNKNRMLLSDEFPIQANQYKYFNELCDIVQTLTDLENERNDLEK